MPFVITSKTGKLRYLLNLGDTIEVEDTRGRRAAFEIVNIMGVTNDFALVAVDKNACERDDDGWTPGVETMLPLDDEEFLAGGDYVVLRRAPSNPGSSATMIPSAVPPTARALRRKKTSRRRTR